MEQAADKVQAESLDAQVDALLGEMSQACELLQTQLGEAAPAPAGEKVGQGKAGEEFAAPIDDLNEQVDDLLKSMSSAIASEPESVAARVAEQSVEDELASLTDSLLAEPSAAASPMPTVTNPTPEAKAVQPTLTVPVAAIVAESLAPVSPAKVHSAASRVVPADAAPSQSPWLREVVARLGHMAGSILAGIGGIVEPGALRAATMVSAPILSKPKHVRDTVGWMAAWSLFVAVSFAVFIFFVRTPPSPASKDAEVRLADEHAGEGHTGEVVRHGLPTVEERAPAAHGEAGGHGEAKGKDAKKPDAKKASAKKPDAKKAAVKKKDAKKPAGEHGEEAAPAEH